MKKVILIFLVWGLTGSLLVTNAHDEGWDELEKVRIVVFEGSLEDWESIKDSLEPLEEEVFIFSGDGEIFTVHPLSDDGLFRSGEGTGGAGTGGHHLSEKNGPRPQFPGSGTAPNHGNPSDVDLYTDEADSGGGVGGLYGPPSDFAKGGAGTGGGQSAKNNNPRPKFPGSGTGGTPHL